MPREKTFQAVTGGSWGVREAALESIQVGRPDLGWSKETCWQAKQFLCGKQAEEQCSSCSPGSHME